MRKCWTMDRFCSHFVHSAQVMLKMRKVDATDYRVWLRAENWKLEKDMYDVRYLARKPQTKWDIKGKYAFVSLLWSLSILFSGWMKYKPRRKINVSKKSSMHQYQYNNNNTRSGTFYNFMLFEMFIVCSLHCGYCRYENLCLMPVSTAMCMQLELNLAWGVWQV